MTVCPLGEVAKARGFSRETLEKTSDFGKIPGRHPPSFPIKQMTFADAEYAGKRKQTRKELFLVDMDQVVPWKDLIALIDPHYPKGEGGHQAYSLMAMLRVHLMQNWFGYSGSAMEEALYETYHPAPGCVWNAFPTKPPS